MNLNEIIDNLEDHNIPVNKMEMPNRKISIIEFYHFSDMLYFIRDISDPKRTHKLYSLNSLSLSSGKWLILKPKIFRRHRDLSEAREALFGYMKKMVIKNSILKRDINKNTLWDKDSNVIKEY